MNALGIVLAAGESKRLGHAKQLVEFRGQTLVVRAVERALQAGCEPVVVVTGANADNIQAALGSTRCSIAHNPDWKLGMGQSIATGMQYIQLLPRVPELILMQLCDQPLVRVEHLVSLLEIVAEGKSPAAATQYVDGQPGIPAVFSALLFDELARLAGKGGAKSVLLNASPRLLPCSEANFDIDFESDVEMLKTWEDA